VRVDLIEPLAVLNGIDSHSLAETFSGGLVTRAIAKHRLASRANHTADLLHELGSLHHK
jgi:hypothetical protein